MEELVGPPAPDVAEVDVEGTACLFSPRVNQAVMLNETASDVWFLCDGTRTISQIVDRLAAVYQVDATAIERDVREAVSRFVDAGLIGA